jgi:hypothetical protein
MSAIKRTAVVVVALSLASPALAQDTLAPVRELYASASYDEALAALDTIAAAGAPSVAVERYRVLCLVALGRAVDAERAIERIVRADPSYTMGDEAAPRIRTVFEQVRGRLLPGIVRAIYADGKDAFERKAFADAERAFRSVIDMIDTPELINRPGMDDLRMVAAGFLSLARAQKTEPRMDDDVETAAGAVEARPDTAEAVVEPIDAAVAEPTDATVAEPVEAVTPPIDAVAPPLEAFALPEAPLEERPPVTTMTVVESSVTLAESVVVEPVPIVQDLPPWTYGEMEPAVPPRGAIIVDIDEEGAVTAARMDTPIHVLYDQELLEAARAWRFEPALRDGRRVPSRARLEVELQR